MRFCQTGPSCVDANGKRTELTPDAESPYCRNCRSSVNRWSKRSAADIIRRRMNLTKYTIRMDMVPRKRKPRVVTVHSHAEPVRVGPPR